jgi:hypothetical protein
VTEEWEAAATPPMTMILRLEGQDRGPFQVLEAWYGNTAFLLIHTDKLQFAAFAEDVGEMFLTAKMFFQRRPLT